MNPPTCPYTYVKIDDQFYKRDIGNCHDDMDYDYKDIPCHDCGVVYGNVHHISCDMERCPIPDCGDQFLSCPHSIEARYYKGLGDSKGTSYTSPIWSQGSFNKGNDFAEQGKYKKAIECYDKAVKERPNNDSIWINRGIALDLLRKHKESLSSFEEAIKLNPTAIAWANKGCTFGVMGRYEDMISCCDEAIRIDPEYAPAWYNMGKALKDLGREKDSERCLAKAYELGYEHNDQEKKGVEN